MKRKQISKLFVLLLLGSTSAFAGSTLKSELGAGLTTNAYLSSESAKSDFFAKYFSSYSADGWGRNYRISAAIYDYSKFHDNDRLLLEAKFPWNKDAWESVDWNWTTNLFWQKYFHEQSALSDASFDYIGGSVEAAREVRLGIPWETNFAADFELTYFPDLESRQDFQARAKVMLDSPESLDYVVLSEFSLAYLTSSLPEYNKMVVTLWGAFERKWIDDWVAGIDLEVRSTTYLNRHVGEETAVSGKRGRTTFVETKERASLTSLNLTAHKDFTAQLLAKARLGLSSQSSNNEFNQYSETVLYIGLNYLW